MTNKDILDGALWHDRLGNPHQEVMEYVLKGTDLSL